MRYKFWLSAVVEVEAEDEDDAYFRAIDKLIAGDVNIDVDDVEYKET